MLRYVTDSSVTDSAAHDAIQGAWITPGIVDLHSHMGDEPSPQLHGSADGNSFKGPIVPWLRSLDALNTHDESYRLAAAGGVTTSLILPGSANAIGRCYITFILVRFDILTSSIGGQAFVIKTRPTKEGSPTSMLLEPPNSNNTHHWRHMKCVFEVETIYIRRLTHS